MLMYNMLNNDPSIDILTPETCEGYLTWQNELDKCDKVMDLKISLSWIM